MKNCASLRQVYKNISKRDMKGGTTGQLRSNELVPLASNLKSTIFTSLVNEPREPDEVASCVVDSTVSEARVTE
jgi:hypothetical protein